MFIMILEIVFFYVIHIYVCIYIFFVLGVSLNYVMDYCDYLL